MPIRRCVICQGTAFENATKELLQKVGGRKFTGVVPCRRCATCGERYVDAAHALAFEADVVTYLALHGLASGETLRLMRKSLGLTAQQLAELLRVAPETISRWEHGKRNVDLSAWAMVASLLAEKRLGKPSAMAALKAASKPPRIPKRVKISRAA